MGTKARKLSRRHVQFAWQWLHQLWMRDVSDNGGETKWKYDGHTAKVRFLSIVSYQPQALGFIFDDVGSDGWMVWDLLYKELSDTTSVRIWPSAIKNSAPYFHEKAAVMQKGSGSLSKNWVQWPVFETCFRKGMKKRRREADFFSEPNISFLDVYWSLRVLMNHLRTARILSWPGSVSAMLAKKSGRSHQ